jgi:signal transduction histidine kinase/CheY-like chemotaxis protein
MILPVTCPDLATRLERAWLLRFSDPRALAAEGKALVNAAADDVGAAGWGWLHHAWGLRFRGDNAGPEQALERAEALFARAPADSPAARHGTAAVRVLRAYADWLAGRTEQGLARLAQDPLDAGHGRPPVERQIGLNTRASLHYALGRWDDTLRDRYAALEAARESGHDGAIGHALGLLGGQQADFANFEDALRLTTEGAERCARAGATHAGIVASMNRLNALVGLDRIDEAVALAQAMHAEAARIPPGQQEQAHIQFAWAHARAGRLDEAQALLDRSVALRVRGHLHEWTLTQAEIWNAQGRHAEARALCEACLADRPTGINSNSPAEWLRTHQASVVACEALGDLAGALKHQRETLVLYEAVLGRSARARRLTLEIEHELEQARRDRAEADHRRQAAEREQARLDELNRALEAASRAKSRFLAAASHDLRQPVHALALQVAALRPHLGSAVQREMVGRIDRCVGALATMFDTLLDLSRIDAGVVEPAPRAVALPALLARLVEEQAADAARRGLRLALRLPPGAASAPPTVLSDPALLERALRNLLVNALRYTRRGGVLLALRRARGEPTDAWRIEVWDSGLGIAPEEQRRVFDEFYQVPSAGAEPSEGLGLGLAIVQRLCQLLDHRLGLASRPGVGSRFVLSCRAAAPEAIVGAPLVTTPSRPLGLHLAVLEDEAEVRAAMRSLLEQWGCEVSEADGAAALLQRLDGRRPDAVLADLRLGAGRDGLAEVQHLREVRGGDLPVLVITGDTAAEHLRRLQASGLPWLAKPVPVDRLHEWLARL